MNQAGAGYAHHLNMKEAHKFTLAQGFVLLILVYMTIVMFNTDFHSITKQDFWLSCIIDVWLKI